MAEKLTGRIVRSLSGFYDVQLPDTVVTCRGRGILRRDHITPLTGDRVEITLDRGKGMVEGVLPRKNSFVRPAVANVDALAIFAANVNPVTEPFLIDRVAAIAGNQNVPCLICVNKSDLDPGENLRQIYEKAGFPVICTSAKTGQGIRELRAFLRGRLTAFTGNSGVGKLGHLEETLAVGQFKIAHLNDIGQGLADYGHLYCIRFHSVADRILCPYPYHRLEADLFRCPQGNCLVRP